MIAASGRRGSASARRLELSRPARARGTACSIRRARPRGFDELAYYAEHFDTVEVNSTFYRDAGAGLSSRRGCGGRRRRSCSPSSSTRSSRTRTCTSRATASATGIVSRGDFDLFRRGIDPLAEAGRLGAMLDRSFRRAFTPSRTRATYLDWLLDALAGYPLAVELRHRSLERRRRRRRPALLDAHGAALGADRRAEVRSSIRQPASVDARRPTSPTRLPPAPRPQRRELVGARRGRGSLRLSLFTRRARAVRGGRADAPPATARRVLMYLNNHFSAKAVANAAVLQAPARRARAGRLSARDGRPLSRARRHRRYFGPAALIVTFLIRSALCELVDDVHALDRPGR